MRSLVVNTFLTLDGVMQSPGGPEEDPTGGFDQGGWGVTQWDDAMNDRMGAFILHLLSGIALSMVGAVPGLVTVVVILLVTRAVQRLVSNIFKAVQKGQIEVPGLHAETAGATRRLAAVRRTDRH